MRVGERQSRIALTFHIKQNKFEISPHRFFCVVGIRPHIFQFFKLTTSFLYRCSEIISYRGHTTAREFLGWDLSRNAGVEVARLLWRNGLHWPLRAA